MGRKKQSAFDDLIELASRLPWWAGLGLALISYLVIHPFASGALSTPTATSLDQMGQVAVTTLFGTLALFGQYLVPAGFVLGAMVSAIGQAKRKKLLAETATATSSEAAKALSWREFEMLVGEMFRNKGFKVQETASGPDGGVDLELRKAGELSLVQCKQWRATKVGVSVVRELFGVMASRGAVHGYVVTSGVFTAEAKRFAQGRNISLIDGQALEREIRRQAAKRESNVTSIKQARRRKSAQAPQNPVAQPAPTATEQPPECPNCGGKMVRRVARRGANAGKAFWGCADSPKCRGIVPLE